MIKHLKRYTSAIAQQPARVAGALSNADRNKADAMAMLDAQAEYSYSKSSMIDELVINFGYTPSGAEDVYDEWRKRH